MKAILIFLTIFLTQTCNKKVSDFEMLEKLPSEIESVYYQNWVGGIESAGSGTIFYVQFKNKFPENIQLKKLYFQNQETNFQEEGENVFTANLTQKPKQDKILDSDSQKEFGNKPPEISKPKLDLKPNEAILEFQKDNKTLICKLQNIKQKELLAYPSAKPRN